MKLLSVLRNKNAVEKKEKRRRAEELHSLKTESMYNSRLHEYMKLIDLALRDEDVHSVIVNIPNNFISNFSKAIFSLEEMAEYDIKQTDANEFEFSRKIIQF